MCIYIFMISKAIWGWWDVSYSKEKMEAGEWINGGNYYFSAYLYLAQWLTSVNDCSITLLQNIHQYKSKNIHLLTTLKHLPVSDVLLHSFWNTWDVAVGRWVTYCELERHGSQISCSLTETWISHVVCGPVGLLRVHGDSDTLGSAAMQQRWKDGVGGGAEKN